MPFMQIEQQISRETSLLDYCSFLYSYITKLWKY